jgi:hypothetical protein
MAIKLHLMVMPHLFLIIGIFAIIIILVPVTNTFSLTQEPNGNTPFTDNANKSELTIGKNSVLLKQLGLYTLSQHLNDTVSILRDIAEAFDE